MSYLKGVSDENASRIAELSNDAHQQVVIFVRQSLQQINISSLSWPSAEALLNPFVQDLLYVDLFEPENLKYPFPARYELQLLKALVSRIESSIKDPNEEEVSDNLMYRLSTLISEPKLPDAMIAQQKSFVTYTVPMPEDQMNKNTPSITLLESKAIIASSGTTGFRTWEAALHLSAWLIESDIVKRKAILELGAGTGLVSLLCIAHLNARCVLATDGDVGLTEELKTNVFLNNIKTGSRFDVAVFRWGTTLERAISRPEVGNSEWDLVLGADVTYDASDMPALVATIRDLFDSSPRLRVILSATVRNENTLDVFFKACAANQFDVTEIAFKRPPMNSQKGLFCLTEDPIKLLSISRNTAAKDPFAL